ncbi:hypothetical protein Y032_0541g3186 [Ancylostoma ceylanicum]|uniref:DUF1758 domain-containing protein n=1 Tax=Ancylostoma ceylanicum TaxID=53326 RepID=A0A016WRC2_9BILA|nr:hypothetical protein Y032_0541g3186 [Ancylostoma ceylanicum]
MILSKFPEFICTIVIQKETECDHPFTVSEIMSTIDAIISLRETTALTTETLFSKDNNENNVSESGINRLKWEEGRIMPRKQKGMCLCGQPHSPYSCPKYTTAEARRNEVRKQKACWRCFARNHQSKDCTAMGLCPRCKEGQHSSLCLSETKRQNSGYLTLPRQPGRNVQLPAAARSQQPPVDRSHHHQDDNRNVQTMHNSQNGRQVFTLDKTATVNNQCVLQTATAMIFNEAEWDYQPITLLLDSGAQKSFIKLGISEELKLRITGSTSFTTSGMGEIQEDFNSNEVQITLKGLHSPKKLKNLSVQTKQKLTTPLTTAELSEADLNFISSSNITVAQQSLETTTVSSDLLIGQDFLSTIIDHNSPVLRLPSGLILTPTVFGYTISGTSPITTKPIVAEIHLSELVLATPIGGCRKTSQIREETVTTNLLFIGNKDNFNVALQSKNSGSMSYYGEEEDQDCRNVAELPSSMESRLTLSELKKPAKKVRTIWNHNYLEFRDQRRWDEGYRGSARSKKEVPAKAKKVLEKKPPKKKESSTRCAGSTLLMKPTSSVGARIHEPLPARQQRHGQSSQWLYRHWLFKENSQLSDSPRTRKFFKDS